MFIIAKTISRFGTTGEFSISINKKKSIFIWNLQKFKHVFYFVVMFVTGGIRCCIKWKQSPIIMHKTTQNWPWIGATSLTCSASTAAGCLANSMARVANFQQVQWRSVRIIVNVFVSLPGLTKKIAGSEVAPGGAAAGGGGGGGGFAPPANPFQPPGAFQAPPQQQQQPFGAPSRFTPAPQQHAFAPPMGGGGGGFRGPPPMQQQRPFAAPPGSSRCIVVLFCSLYIVSSTFSIFSTIWWRRPAIPQSTKGWLVSSRCQPLIHSHIYIKHK